MASQLCFVEDCPRLLCYHFLIFFRDPSLWGLGTNTSDRSEFKVHKRVIETHSSPDVVKQITSINMDPAVAVEITVADQNRSGLQIH